MTGRLTMMDSPSRDYARLHHANIYERTDKTPVIKRD